MHNMHSCVTDDSYQLAYEHLRQLECAAHFHSSTEVSPFKLASSKHQMPDGENQCFYSKAEVGDYHICSVAKDMEFKKGLFLDSSLAAESSLGTEVVENGKRPSSYFFSEAVNKRARQQNQAGKGKISEETEWTRATAGNLTFPWLDQPAWLCFYEGSDVDHRILGLNQLEDVYEHSHWRHVPVGPDHQADIPKCTTSSPDLHEAGTCVMPMPDFDSIAKIGCDCTDEGSIRCVRNHVKAAREKLSRALGKEKFMEMGFSDMGEVVAQRWTEEEENLFDEVVLSNPASAGRNFWPILRRAFSSRSFKELISYYFNVFILRKRAHQNRFDRLNVDSDNDEWQEEEDDSAVVSSPDGNGNAVSKPETIDRNSKDCSEDQSCTSYERHVDGFDSKSWKSNYVVETKKEIDFFPTCSVLEEVFGKGCLEKDARNGSGFS